MISPRHCALEIFHETVQNGGFSNLLYKERANAYEERDRKLITLLVNDSLSHYFHLQYILNSLTKGKSIKPIIKSILLMAIDQLTFLEMPEHAVINESVELCAAVKKPMLKGFVNGVLRGYARNKEIEYPPKDTLEYYAVINSKPLWLLELWQRDYGFENAVKYAQIKEQQSIVRFKSGFNGKQWLDNHNIEYESITQIKNAFQVKGVYSILNSKEYNQGVATIQGIGSMIACKALNVKSGDKVLDACSAPGGKTAYICELMGEGEVVACDIYPNRLKLVEENIKRCGYNFVKTVAQDMTVLNEEFINSFDCVLVDAPCSGLGELNSKPDILLKKTFDDVISLSKIQLNILNCCSRYVKSGGTLVYSTCTLNKIENDGVVDSFLKDNKDFVLSEFELDDLSRYKTLQLTPDIYEGFFVARFVKK